MAKVKYFTARMWASLQTVDPVAFKRADRSWERAFARYKVQLKPLLLRLGSGPARFFTHHSLHDGKLLRACVGDAVAQGVTPRSPVRPGTTVQLDVMVGYPKPFLYHLRYEGIESFDIKPDRSRFPSGEGSLFGDWGYDELTPEGKASLRHSVLFASGTELSVVFKGFRFKRQRMREKA